MATVTTRESASAAEQSALDKRLDGIGWGLFLVMIGALFLVPDNWLPEGTWLVGTGLIMLGLNGVRYLKGLRMNGFTLVVGLAALVIGLSEIAAVDVPVLPILLVAVGAVILYEESRRRGTPRAHA